MFSSLNRIIYVVVCSFQFTFNVKFKPCFVEYRIFFESYSFRCNFNRNFLLTAIITLIFNFFSVRSPHMYFFSATRQSLPLLFVKDENSRYEQPDIFIQNSHFELRFEKLPVIRKNNINNYLCAEFHLTVVLQCENADDFFHFKYTYLEH